MTVTHEALQGLLDKYLEIVRLREDAAAGRTGDPRRAMTRLAARYPGALRELDQRPMADLSARVAALGRTLRGETPATWMRLWIDYHGWMRVALAIKRQRARGVERIGAWLQEEYRPVTGDPPRAAWSRDVVASVLRPPGGRLNRWVFAQLGQRHGLAADEVERELFRELER